VAYKINSECIKCGACASVCPVEAISDGDTQYVIDPGLCIDCGACAAVCPVGAISPDE
jgi:ferredoxin